MVAISEKFLTSDLLRRSAILIFILALCYLLREVIDILLFTFLIIFITISLHGWLKRRFMKAFPVNQLAVFVVLIIVLATVGIGAISKYTPIAATETGKLYTEISDLLIAQPHSRGEAMIKDALKTVDFNKQIAAGAQYLLQLSVVMIRLAIALFLAVVFSIFFFLERNNLTAFIRRFADSKVSLVYEDLRYIGKKFLESFGKVMNTQAIIATFNALLSTVAFAIAGFPHILALSIMIFCFGLVPVAGAIISVVPLILVGYSVHGFIGILYALLIVVVLHSFEAYFLNPRLLASKMHLPIFVSFLVLIISEKTMGTWGLILGIPLFVFLLDLVGYDLKAKLK